ncbi:MAG: Threonine synthase [Candidatus Bathyarchaeota archaeon BA1]|nr:MAG: Threonine synthase [Candidatus Bathyarchaeota archaeon BA1]
MTVLVKPLTVENLKVGKHITALSDGDLSQSITLKDVYEARRNVSKYLPRTPLVRSTALSRRLGFEAYVKCENLQPIGAFKVRGGVNLISSLSEDERLRGVITASTGNHGQSIAYAASLFGVKAVIVVPKDANPYKVEAIKDLGAVIEFHGLDFDEARLWVEEEAKRKGYMYVHPANEPLLIAGVGTLYLEIMEDLSDVETIIVPIGGGSGAAAACIVAKSINPKVKVIGVQAEKAPSVYLSWRNKKMIETESAETFAEGLATRVPFKLTLDILNKMIDGIVLVSEEEMKKAILTLLETTHQLAEGAGAASTAAAFKIKDELQGRKVALILTGGNLTLDTLKNIFNEVRGF